MLCSTTVCNAVCPLLQLLLARSQTGGGEQTTYVQTTDEEERRKRRELMIAMQLGHVYVRYCMHDTDDASLLHAGLSTLHIACIAPANDHSIPPHPTPTDTSKQQHVRNNTKAHQFKWLSSGCFAFSPC